MNARVSFEPCNELFKMFFGVLIPELDLRIVFCFPNQSALEPGTKGFSKLFSYSEKLVRLSVNDEYPILALNIHRPGVHRMLE